MDDFCDTFRFVLPKGLFLHRKWLAEYSRPELQPLRTHVDQHAGHCDDVALNYVVANVTRQSAVVMTERVIDFAESSSAGLYDGSSEAAKQTREDLRTECVQVIDAYFRGVSPPPFYVEKPAFAQRLQGRKPPAVRDSRKYSLLFKAMGQCIGSRGEPPR